VVPAVGDPDLSDGRSLAETIRAGNPDAIAGFRDAHIAKVRSYCAQVCPSDRIDETCEAALREFVTRVRESDARRVNLGRELLRATRSAAAGRFELSTQTDAAVCVAMPELIAAEANGELRAEASSLHRHERACPTCAETAERMRRAEEAFAHATGWIPTGR
jgi:hypothetical protein